MNKRIIYIIFISIFMSVLCVNTANTPDIKRYISYKNYSLYLLDFNYKEYNCLNKLYTKESNWNPKAKNGSHYGIPQGRSTYLASLNGYDQVQWGLNYIGHRYGSTCVALAHWKVKGWH